MKDKISEWMDGELDERAGAAVFDALRLNGEAAEAWRTYHLISDAMRDTAVLSEGFAARFSARLAAEPTVLAPRPRPRPSLMLAAAASITAVALVGWLAFAPAPQPAAPQVAAAPKVPVQRALPKAANDYLLAHQGSSPRVYLQGMAPYVRTVSEPADEPGK